MPPIQAPGEASGPLFSAEDLNAVPGVGGVSEPQAAMVERIVWGWLKPVLGLTERPAPVPEEVFSWAIELGAIAQENPNGLSYYQLGQERYGFSAERRSEILETAGSGGQASGIAKPLGSFPAAAPWPDPARCR